MTEPLRLGGMALRNGLLVHGPTSWAAAVRAPDGTLHAASGRKPELPAAALRLPLVRGVARMGEMLALLPIVRRGTATGAPSVRGRARGRGRARHVAR